jgi:uncharacterized cupredoxin-like copper-binding protein
MKKYAFIAIAALALWLAGSVIVEWVGSDESARVTSVGLDRHPPAMTQVAKLGGPVDRHPSAMTQVATLSGPVDRHPPATTQVATLVPYGVDRHPPATTQVATLVPYGVDRHPPATTQVATLVPYGVDRHPPSATQYAALNGQEPIQVVLQFGTETKSFALTPKSLRFETGKLYKLVIVNPSKTAHVVFAPEFGVAIDSISLTQGVALKQGDRQTWYFVADQAGTYDIMCGHKAHVEAGMMGKIIVSPIVS